MTSSTPHNPWYREPWPWFLMTGPLLAILGCMITIYLAVTNFADQAIVDGAVRRGLVVERAQPAPSHPGAATGAGTSGAAGAAPTRGPAPAQR